MRRWNAKAYVINEKMKYPCDKCDCDVKLMKSWIYGIQAVKKEIMNISFSNGIRFVRQVFRF